MTTIPTSHTDVDALRRAYASHDLEPLLDLYADDATIEIVDAQNTPSKPQLLSGKAAIRAHHEDILARDMTHELDSIASTPEALGYVVRCRYPDGTRVVCSTVAARRDGKIASQVVVQAWDA